MTSPAFGLIVVNLRIGTPGTGSTPVAGNTTGLGDSKGYGTGHYDANGNRSRMQSVGGGVRGGVGGGGGGGHG